jgi:hypothetical protein
MYANITEIKAANEAAGRFWFRKDTLAFFKSKVYPTVVHGHYFITRETNPSGETAFSVRSCFDGEIDTVGEFFSHATHAEALAWLTGFVAGQEAL